MKSLPLASERLIFTAKRGRSLAFVRFQGGPWERAKHVERKWREKGALKSTLRRVAVLCFGNRVGAGTARRFGGKLLWECDLERLAGRMERPVGDVAQGLLSSGGSCRLISSFNWLE